MVERTLRGLDKNNKPFAAYKESYTKDSRFKTAGKSQGLVNLKLTRSMLNGIKLLRHAPGVLVIGFEPGRDNDIAAWNRLPRHGKVRDFLGLRPSEVTKITNSIALPDPILIGIAQGSIDRILSDNEENNGGNK